MKILMNYALSKDSDHWTMSWSYSDASYVTHFKFHTPDEFDVWTVMWIHGDCYKMETKEQTVARHDAARAHDDEPNDDGYARWLHGSQKYEAEAVQRFQAIRLIVDLA